MSGLQLPDFGALGKSILDFVSYWRKFKGKRVRITGPSTSTILVDEFDTKELHSFKEILEGIIDEAQAYPPGLFIEDIEEFVRHEWTAPHYVVNQKEPGYWYRNVNDSTERKKTRRKFLAFGFITSIEFIDE